MISIQGLWYVIGHVEKYNTKMYENAEILGVSIACVMHMNSVFEFHIISNQRSIVLCATNISVELVSEC